MDERVEVLEVMEVMEGGRIDKFSLTVTNGAGKLNTTSVLIKTSVWTDDRCSESSSSASPAQSRSPDRIFTSQLSCATSALN